MTISREHNPLKCSAPIDAAVLADYWNAALRGSDEEAVEEHLLACDSCGARLRKVMALAESIRGLAREGALRVVVSDEFLRRAAAEGLRVREYVVPNGGGVQCTVAADDDLLIGRLVADLSGAERIDLSLCDDRGVEQVRLPDIPFSAAAGSVAYQESITAMKAAPSMKLIARLVAVDPSGAERQIGEYTFNHTRTMPGPAAW
jgi:hypothetical protein